MDRTYRKDLTEELRELAGIAQEREKKEDVATLLKQFEEWKQTISSHVDLGKVINATHDIIGKNRWKEYVCDNEFIVIRALYKNIITHNELSAELYDSLKVKLNVLKKILG